MEKTPLTGLEMLNLLKNGEKERPSMGKTIPLQLKDVKPGWARFEARADENHLNPVGMVHGGFAATVLDSAMGCALQSTALANEFFATVDLNVKLLKPVPVNQPLIVEANKIHASNRIGVAEGELKDEEGIVYAHATSTCMVIKSQTDG